MAIADNWGRISRFFTSSLSEMNPFRGDEPYLSVDIGSSSIKVLEVRGRSGQLRITNAGTIATPPSAIQNNMVFEPGAVAGALQSLIESGGFSARKVVTAVPGPAVIIKRMTVPTQSTRELENTILFEAGNFIPEDLENVNLDYQITDYVDEAKQMEVLLVAAKKDIVASYSDTLREAGLSPVVVDVDYFALENMFELNYEAPTDRAIALVNVGARYSCVNILKNGRSTFTGDVPVGGRSIIDSLIRDLAVTTDEAEALQAGQDIDAIPPDLQASYLESAASGLIDEIHHALTFFWTASSDEPIDTIYLSGGVARMPGLTQQLGDRIGAPVEIANPFARLQLDRRVDTQKFRAQAPDYAVALGLATRRPNDK